MIISPSLWYFNETWSFAFDRRLHIHQQADSSGNDNPLHINSISAGTSQSNTCFSDSHQKTNRLCFLGECLGYPSEYHGVTVPIWARGCVLFQAGQIKSTIWGVVTSKYSIQGQIYCTVAFAHSISEEKPVKKSDHPQLCLNKNWNSIAFRISIRQCLTKYIFLIKYSHYCFLYRK